MASPICNCEGGFIRVQWSGVFWITSGVEPDQHACHVQFFMQELQAFEDNLFETEGLYVCSKGSPEFGYYEVPNVSRFDKAEPILDENVNCNLEAYNEHWQNGHTHWEYIGRHGYSYAVEYCLSYTEPVPPVDPPDEGVTECGTWSVNFVEPINPTLNTPIWVEFELEEDFPVEITDPIAYYFFFDDSEELVGPTGSGIVQFDFPNRRVQVVLRDYLAHKIAIVANQEGCQSPQRMDVLFINVPEPPPAMCAQELAEMSIKVCASGTYKAVITSCEQDITSNELVITTDPSQQFLPNFILQPESTVVLVGERIDISAVAQRATSYQWQKRAGSVWNNIVGETSTVLQFEAMTPAIAGAYRVIASNSAGSVISNIGYLSVDCNGWEPGLYLQEGPLLIITHPTRGPEFVVAEDSEFLGVPGVDSGSQTTGWRIDNINITGTGSVLGVDYEITSPTEIKVTVTDSAVHSLNFRVSLNQCAVGKSKTIKFRAAIPDDFGPRVTEYDEEFTGPIAASADPSIYMDLTNKSAWEDSELEVSVFTGVDTPTHVDTPVVELQGGATALGPSESGRIKMTLTPDGVADIGSHTGFDPEVFEATWEDAAASSAFGIDASGTITITANSPH